MNSNYSSIYQYLYECTWWDETEKQTEEGIVAGANYPEAMAKLTDYYGENEIIKLTIKCITDGAIIHLPSGLLAAIENAQI